MKRARMGDVYSVKVPNGYKIYQWAYSIPREGDYIRVFDGLHEYIPTNLPKIVAGPHSYIIPFDTKRAYRIGLAQMLGNFPVPDEYPFPEYEFSLHPNGAKKIGAIVVRPTIATSTAVNAGQWFRVNRIQDLPPQFQNITLLSSRLSPGWLLYLFDIGFTLYDLDCFFPGDPGANGNANLQKYTDIVNEVLARNQTKQNK